MSTLLAAGSPDALATVLFYVFGGMTALAAIGVVVSQNIVRTAVCLLLALLGVGGLYLSMHAEFLAAVQLVVYAGGTLVLIIFGVMLTNNSTQQLYRAKRIEVILGGALALFMAYALITAILYSGLGSRAADGKGSYPILNLGEAFLGDYLAPFELISVLLLAVMIGAAYLAKGRRKGQEG
jgi:NADH:ubiquinone oxidoreductase subunit 6 (subunit J)